jgi:hypothetical protein
LGSASRPRERQEHLEQELGPRRRQRHIAELVDDEELHRLKVALLLQKAAFVTGFHELVNEARRGVEGDGKTVLAGGQFEGQGRVALAGAGDAERDDVLPVQNELASLQLAHQHLVEARDRGEVEGVEALDRREPGRPNPPFDRAAFPTSAPVRSDGAGSGNGRRRRGRTRARPCRIPAEPSAASTA